MNFRQKNLLNLLNEFDEISKKYDIDYFIAAGTALGAIRHGGFLPWDDDMDIYLTRDNWNKLKEVIESGEIDIPEMRTFAYHENTKYYRNAIPRYINQETSALFKSQALAGKSLGQHLEFLILDPMPAGEDKEKEYIDLFRVYAELLSPFFTICRDLSIDEWNKHFELYNKYFEKANIVGDEEVLKELGDELQNYPTEECERYCMRWGDLIYTYPKEYIENHRFSTFEGKQIPVSQYVETMMRIAYGDDWMYVPEIKNQIDHPHLEDYTTSCLEYSKRYIPKVNREEVLKRYRHLKYTNLCSFAKTKRIEMLNAKINVNSKSKIISKSLEGKEEYLSDLLETKDYEAIVSEFDEYMGLQLRYDVKKYDIFVPISDRNLEILLTCLVEKGEYYKVDRYLNIRKKHDENLSDGLANVENLVKCCRELSIARYDKKDEKLVQSLIDKYDSRYPDLLDIHRAKLWIRELNAKSGEDYKDIDKSCDEILKMYPFDGEIMAIQAKAKAECGEETESIDLYNKAINNTRNGLIWRKVEEETGISRYKMEYDFIEEAEE
ncbi:phosphorylcholine transferase LicD [Methanobrevibacter sp.]|uniref:LicD family protein n=1 Tax=Methanobrevibacter sp. TaxID=66852 RepID=UPI00387057A9